MFNLFSKKPAYKITDLIWISDQSKLNGCLKELQEKNYDFVAAWFPETIRRFDLYFKEQGKSIRIQRAGELQLSDMKGKEILLLEHYPLMSTESQLFERWTGSVISIASSLDEVWLEQFGVDNIRRLMTKLGMREDEVLSHSAITSAIQNAQKKLEKSIGFEMKANSMEEWFRLNIRT